MRRNKPKKMDIPEQDIKFISVYCPLCKSGPHPNREVLVDHLTTCQKVKCPLCCREFKNSNNLIRHLKMPLCVIPRKISNVDNLVVVDIKPTKDKVKVPVTTVPNTSRPVRNCKPRILQRAGNAACQEIEIPNDPIVVIEQHPQSLLKTSPQINPPVFVVQDNPRSLLRTSPRNKKIKIEEEIINNDVHEVIIGDPIYSADDSLSFEFGNIGNNLEVGKIDVEIGDLDCNSFDLTNADLVTNSTTVETLDLGSTDKSTVKQHRSLPEYIVTEESSGIEVLKFWIKNDEMLNKILEKVNDISCNDIASNVKYVTKKKKTKTVVAISDRDCMRCLRCYVRIGLSKLSDHFPVCNRFKTRRLCGKCGKEDFANINDAFDHYKLCSPLNEKANTCYFCKKSYKTPAYLREHVYLAHLDQYRHKCDLCSSGKFKTKPALRNHMASFHKIDRKPCPYCGKDFTNGTHLSAHIRCMHTGELPYQCDHCGRRLARSEDLAMHRKRVEKGLQCPKIKNFSEQRDKNERFDYSKSTLYRCHLCSRIFKPRDAAVAHIRAHFQNQLTQTCTHCGNMFSSKRGLQLHEERGHVAPPKNKKIQTLPEDEIDKLRADSVDGHQCHLCEKIFLTKSHLFGHIKTHSKVFQCSFCPRKFSYRKYLTAHLPIHKNNSADTFSCAGCAATFTIKRSLENHLKTCSVVPPEIEVNCPVVSVPIDSQVQTFEIEFFTVENVLD